MYSWTQTEIDLQDPQYIEELVSYLQAKAAVQKEEENRREAERRHNERYARQQGRG